MGDFKPGNELTFNIEDGCLEAIVHGYRAGLLTKTDYTNLAQCETLEDMKVYLSGTDYGNFLANEPGPLTSTIIVEKAQEKLAREFNELRFQAVYPLSQFLDFITYEHMIANVLKLITGIKHERGILDIMYKCHPLGIFETLPAITSASSFDEMYKVVLVGTPIAPFFRQMDKRDFSEFSTAYNKEILQKKYLESFYDFCEHLGGPTFEVMAPILEFEADRQVLTIARQSFNSKELKAEDKKNLFPDFGQLHDYHTQIAAAEDDVSLRKAIEPLKEFTAFFDNMSGKGGSSLETELKKRAIEHQRDAFCQQFQYGSFYAFVKLREHEISNLLWIAECIKQGMRNRIMDFVC